MNASINAFHLSQKTAISYNECIQAIDVDSDHDTNIFSAIDLLFAFSHQNQICIMKEQSVRVSIRNPLTFVTLSTMCKS